MFFFLIFALLLPFSSFSQPRPPIASNHNCEFQLVRTSTKTGAYEQYIETRHWQQLQIEKQHFEHTVSKLPEPQRLALLDLLQSLRAIDYKDQVVPVLRLLLAPTAHSSSLEKSKLPKLYDTRATSYFKPIQDAEAFLENIDTTEASALSSPTLIREMHKRINPTLKGAGEYREVAVYGDETSGNGLTDQEIIEINKNKFLTFEPDEVNTETQRTFGKIWYPSVGHLSAATESILQKQAEPLYLELQKFKSAPLKRGTSTLEKKLNRQIMDALVAISTREFNEKAATYWNLRDYSGFVQVCAIYYRELISIHPFIDGNGRTLRLVALYSPLDQIGLSRPRLVDPDRDTLTSEEEWIKQVERGILATHKIYTDIQERIELGLPATTSGELLYPDLPRNARIRQINKTERQAQVIPLAHLRNIEASQFSAFIETEFNRDADAINQAIQEDALAWIETEREKFKQFCRQNRFVLVTHKKNQPLPEVGEGIETALIAPDYKFALLSKLSSAPNSAPYRWSENETRWNFFNKHFLTSKTIWRGLSYADRIPTREEIIALFTDISEHTVSNHILNAGLTDFVTAKNKKALRHLIDEDLYRWNAELTADYRFSKTNAASTAINQNISTTAADHHEAREGYSTSPLASFSRSRAIAKSFAMGALVLDSDFKSYKKKQNKLKARVIVGAYQPKAAAEVNTLRYFSPEFRARFPRQYEVLVPGGLPPEAVHTVELIDEKGNTLQKFIRDADHPNEIIEILY